MAGNEKLIRVDAKNLETEHICCAIGDDAVNKARAAEKKAHLACRFSAGHVFLKADVRGKVFIEYGPAEEAWFPVEAPGWTFVQCFWVSGRYKGTGLGASLLEACEKDARAAASFGVFALSAKKGKKPFLTDGGYLASKGYKLVDEALGYGLFSKALKKAPTAPRIVEGARSGKLQRIQKGVDLFYTPQCPFAPAFAAEMAMAAKGLGLPVRLVAVESRSESLGLRAPPGIFQAYLDGSFLTHELMTGEKFRVFLGKAGKGA
jgi:GNAT superfamily N-acetyltransferase